MKRISIVPAVALLGAFFMVLSPHTAGRRVVVSSYKYAPAFVRIEPGDAVTFSNVSKTTHTATCSNCGADTGDIQPGLAKTVTFGVAGTYVLACRYHASLGMQMTVQVGSAAGAAPPTAAASPSGSP